MIAEVTAKSSVSFGAVYRVIKISTSLVKWGKSKLEKEYRTFRILKNRNWVKLKDDFSSVYFHSLFEFESSRSKSLIKLFSVKEVVSSFEKEFRERNSWSFKTELEHHLHTNFAVRELKLEQVDIEVELNQFHEIFLETLSKARSPGMVEIKNILDDTKSDTSEIKESLENLSQQSHISALNKSYLQELDYPREKMDNYQPQEALDFLYNFKNKKWSSADDIVKYKVLANIGLCYLQLHKEEEASDYLIQSEQFNSDEPKALGFFALAYALRKNRPEFDRVFKKAKEIGNVVSMVYSALILIDDGVSDTEELISQIPNEFRNDTQIAFAIGRHHSLNKNYPEAVRWMRTAVENDENRTFELKGILGTNILVMVADYVDLMTNQIKTETKSQIQEAITLINEGWEGIKSPEMHKSRYHWILNRGIGKKFLGDYEGAYQDIKEASVLHEDLLTLRHLGIISMENGKPHESVLALERLLELKIESQESDFEMELLLAEAYTDVDRKQDAIDLVLKTIDKGMDDRRLNEARSLLVRVYLEENNIPDAKMISSQIISEYPEEIIGYLNAAMVAIAEEDKELAENNLRIATEKVSDSTGEHELYILANNCHRFQLFDLSAKLFEKLANKAIPSRATTQLIEAYFSLGKYKEALEICGELRANNVKDAAITEREVIIYLSLSNLPRAIEICNEFLDKEPLNSFILSRLSKIYFQQAENEKCRETLMRIKSFDEFPMDVAFEMAHLKITVGAVGEGLELGYELRRKYHNHSFAHTSYINLFLLSSSKVSSMMTANSIKVGTAVILKRNNGNVSSHIIVDRDDANVSMGEIKLSDTLAQKIFGKNVGDIIELNDDFDVISTAEILGIRSKYAFAHEQSMDLLQNTFVEEKGFKIFSAEGETAEERTRYLIDFIKKSVEQSKKHDDAIVDFYKSGLLTIGHFASLKSTSELEIWAGLIHDPSMGIKSSMLDFSELSESLNLTKNGTPIVLDITSILTLNSMDALDKLLQGSHRLIISQKVLDSLRRYLSFNEGIGALGKMTITKVDDQFVRHELSKEQIEHQVNIVKELIKWLDEKCHVLPCNELISIDKSERKQMFEVMGDVSLESILLAKEHDAILYSEETNVRAISGNQFGVKGMSTQMFLYNLWQMNLITRQDYDGFSVKLLKMNYLGLFLDKNLLKYALYDSEMKVTGAFTKALAILNGGNSNEGSATVVAVGFIKELYTSVAVKELRDNIILATINELFKNRPDIRNMIMIMGGAIEKDFPLLQMQKIDFQRLIELWLEQNGFLRR